MIKVTLKTECLIPPVEPVHRAEKKMDLDRERDALRGSYVRECECKGYTRLGRYKKKEIRRSVRVV